MKIKKLEGLVAAAHTPFKADGSVNLALIPKQAETLIKQKVTGVYISGTTGEGICCSLDERKAVFDAWVKAAKGKLFLASPPYRTLSILPAFSSLNTSKFVPFITSSSQGTSTST